MVCSKNWLTIKCFMVRSENWLTINPQQVLFPWSQKYLTKFCFCNHLLYTSVLSLTIKRRHAFSLGHFSALFPRRLQVWPGHKINFYLATFRLILLCRPYVDNCSSWKFMNPCGYWDSYIQARLTLFIFQGPSAQTPLHQRLSLKTWILEESISSITLWNHKSPKNSCSFHL